MVVEVKYWGYYRRIHQDSCARFVKQTGGEEDSILFKSKRWHLLSLFLSNEPSTITLKVVRHKNRYSPYRVVHPSILVYKSGGFATITRPLTFDFRIGKSEKKACEQLLLG
jgi:hypothetical protein